MLITKQNVRGGPKLKDDSFAITEEQGVLGYRIGYMGKCAHCGRGAGEQIVIRTIDAERIANKFASAGYTHKSFLSTLKFMKPQKPFKERLFIWLFGKTKYRELREEYEDEIGE